MRQRASRGIGAVETVTPSVFGVFGWRGWLVLWSLFATFHTCSCSAGDLEARGKQFIGFSHFGTFEKLRGERTTELVLTSPVIVSRIKADQVIASWDVTAPPGTWIEVELRGIYPDHATKFYKMGVWSEDPKRHPRESIPGQKDDDGNVLTDTLLLKNSGERFQFRILLHGETRVKPTLKFLCLCLTDSKSSPKPLEPNRLAWGRLIDVPERSQMPYPNGNELCSPTTVSMLMTHWARVLKRPELDHDVPDIVRAVYDPNWRGTGNWPFNTAYAGSYQGMLGYVTRMTDISEIEDWIANGIPIGLSVSYNLLRGRSTGGSGHLVVCVGFTENGDPIINDPGTSKNVRKVFPRKNLAAAWVYSRNTVYLIYPEHAEVPTDRFGHWHSWTAHKRVSFVRP
jgi:hypothetical protein